MIGGVSVLDAPRLSVRNRDQAKEFIKSYGFLWDDENDRRLIHSYFRQAVTFLQERFVDERDQSLSEFFDDSHVMDARDLLVVASDRDHPDRQKLQKWACTTLKVMHVIAHLNSDFYSIFDDEIRSQILNPIQSYVVDDSIQGATFLRSENEKIRINKFEFKPIKDQSSGIIKLLAKKD